MTKIQEWGYVTELEDIIAQKAHCGEHLEWRKKLYSFLPVLKTVLNYWPPRTEQIAQCSRTSPCGAFAQGNTHYRC